jgi:hypothetical protein
LLLLLLLLLLLPLPLLPPPLGLPTSDGHEQRSKASCSSIGQGSIAY